MGNIKDVTNSAQDWGDFWDSPETHDEWNFDDFERIWNEMEEIEPLTTKN